MQGNQRSAVIFVIPTQGVQVGLLLFRILCYQVLEIGDRGELDLFERNGARELCDLLELL